MQKSQFEIHNIQVEVSKHIICINPSTIKSEYTFFVDIINQFLVFQPKKKVNPRKLVVKHMTPNSSLALLKS